MTENYTDMFLDRSKSRHVRVGAFLILVAAVAVCLFHISTVATISMQPYCQLLISLSSIMILAYLIKPLSKKLIWRALDFVCIAIIIAVTVYIISDYRSFELRYTSASTTDLLAATAYLVVFLEILRRHLGYAMFGICILLILMNVFDSPC